MFIRIKKIAILSLLITLIPSQIQGFWGLDSLWNKLKENSVIATGLLCAAGIAAYCCYSYYKKKSKSSAEDKPSANKTANQQSMNQQINAPASPKVVIAEPEPHKKSAISKDEPSKITTTNHAKPANQLATNQQDNTSASPKVANSEPELPKKSAMPKNETSTLAATTPTQEEETWGKFITQAQELIGEISKHQVINRTDFDNLKFARSQIKAILLRCSTNLYDDLNTHYTPLFDKANIDKHGIYKRLKYASDQEGINQTVEQALERLTQELTVKNILVAIGGNRHSQDLFLIDYLMKNSFSKQNFDCYLQGKEATTQLQIYSPKIKSELKKLSINTAKMIKAAEKTWDETVKTFNEQLKQRTQIQSN